jgi:hypothetical protein
MMAHIQKSSSSPGSNRPGVCRADGGNFGASAKYTKFPNSTARNALPHLRTCELSFSSAADLKLET